MRDEEAQKPWTSPTSSPAASFSTKKDGSVLEDLGSSIHGDLDILDVDEREKMVMQMWNAYKHSSTIRLPSFWRDAFGAAYQDLTSEVASVRDAALSEIAKMSFRSRDVYEPPPVQSTAR
ncbi:UNVERIFIED_CONTAM: hypothetical protein Slati_2576900 [Sesamum latifolium]|uniref:Uncharacterized protein n=1 Tax=Sesamum latifolium TaxID=2727402 RepID=A0AAW2VTL0_9LAMI